MSHAAQAIPLFARSNDRRRAMQARINLALAHAVHEHWVEAMPHLNRMVEYARADDRLAAGNAAVTEAKAMPLRWPCAWRVPPPRGRQPCLCGGPARVGTC
jgi:hypothetical protein